MKRVWNITPRNPSFDLENREMRLALHNMDGTEQKIPFSLIFYLFFAAASPTDHTCLCMMVTAPFGAASTLSLSLIPTAPASTQLCFANTVDRTHIEGSCKGYAGKTNWKKR